MNQRDERSLDYTLDLNDEDWNPRVSLKRTPMPTQELETQRRSKRAPKPTEKIIEAREQAKKQGRKVAQIEDQETSVTESEIVPTIMSSNAEESEATSSA